METGHKNRRDWILHSWCVTILTLWKKTAGNEHSPLSNWSKNTFAWYATSWDRDTPNLTWKTFKWMHNVMRAYVCVYSQSWHELMSHKLSCSKSQQVLFESNSKYFRGKQDAVAFWNPNIWFWRNHHAVVALAAAVGVRSKTKKTSCFTTMSP